jgi:predicted alpha/beta-hydrolase family hydrolase
LTDLIFDGSENEAKTIVLAHGAGAAMDTPIVNDLSLVGTSSAVIGNG